jgi:DNA repair exonuclease SbcCD ATPase subunit
LDIGQYYGFELDGDHKFIGEGYHLLRNSGKTHTMMGTETNRGLIPRICETLFAKKDDDLHIELSYIEIYKDNIRDLLDKSLVNKGSLLIRQHPVYGVYVESVRKIVIRDYSELQSCLLIGIENRATGSTKMNNQSSRSHAIMTLYLSKIKTEKREIITKLHLIDLAGSEDSRVTGVSKDQLSESVKINLSLTILRRVLATIVEKQTQKKSIHVPFHDSKLTHFLKESLGGNSCTYMIANVSSDPTYERDTKNTLDYANIASKVINTARVIEVNPEEAIETLKKEIDILRMQLKNNENKTNSSVDINRLKEELHVKECLYNEKEKTWEHKLNESQTELERIRQEQELREQEHKREINVFSAELDKKSRENADLSAELSQLKQRILANNDARIMVSPSNSRSRSSSLPPVTLEDVKNLEKLIMEKSASNDFYEIKIQEHKQTIEQLKKTNEELKDEIAKRDMTIEISTEQFRQERMILHHKIEQLKSKISRMEKSEDNGTEILYIEYDELKRKYDADSKKHDELLNEIKTSNTKIENNRELLSQLIEKNEDAKRETESLDAKLFEIKEKYKIIQDNIEQAKQEYETILKKKISLKIVSVKFTNL